ncbi:unnamed protein product [Effrenium voratum]|uniref:Ion transport domain-containing protein n=1 Tax=Effrenium voratum TaxID=2562239 RepID=A0AA36HRF1_9DINO|nr:unnamed protein product [Effrenium voratum]CAJ1412713.1 unnamed protein product [Effrenium voratum]|mmetsp:Transcript_13320/g.31630  ORF Transcript_13320/g.31630 Transcript_13320/m.31630 type:complete len:702 (-) Transcript_13320:57-2162(-)
MTERWRDILKQLSSELERQTAKLQALETENLQLRQGHESPMSSPAAALRVHASPSDYDDDDRAQPEINICDRRSTGSPTSSCSPSKPWDATSTHDETHDETNGKETEPNEPQEVWGGTLKRQATEVDVELKQQFETFREREKLVQVQYERKPWYVVNPQRSNKFAAWQVITMLALGFVVTVVPFQVGLMELKWDLILLTSTLVDGIFLIDVCLQFVTMYPRATNSGTIWEQKVGKISRHYVKTWFALDAMTLIPFDIIDLAFNADSVGTFKGTKIIRALRLLKLMRILKTSRWLHRVEIAISIPYQQFALFRFLLILVLVCHWLACIWAMTLQLADPIYPQWINDIEIIDSQFGIITRDSPLRTYISSLYFCTYTMTSVGYGDIGPKNIAERIVCTLIVLTAGLCWAYVLGEVCAIVSDMNAESQGFRKKMTELNRMMKEQGLPYDLRCRMRSFFLQNRYQALYVTRQKLRECMSPQLQSEICTAVNAPWISKVHFFSKFMEYVEDAEAKGVDVDAYRACIADVSRELNCGAFSQGERFDNVQVLYIVSKGIVALNSRVGTNGAVWGEDFVLQDTSLIRPIKGCALTYLEVLFLTREKFMKVIEHRRHTCPFLGQVVRQFCVRLAVRRGFIREAERRSGVKIKPKILVKTVKEHKETSPKSANSPKETQKVMEEALPPPQLPSPKNICPKSGLPGSLNDEC